jgi:hypothetical protein
MADSVPEAMVVLDNLEVLVEVHLVEVADSEAALVEVAQQDLEDLDNK